MHELADLDVDTRTEMATRLLDTRFDDSWLSEHPSDRALAEMMGVRRSAVRDAEQLRGERAQLEPRCHHDVWDRLARVGCPTFVASGRFDGIAPPANGTAIASRIPGAELRVYEGGHTFFAQDRRALPDIIDFLDS